MMNGFRQWAVRLGGLLLLAAMVLTATSSVQAQDENDFTYAGNIPAPEFPEGLTWLNIDEPLTFEDLRGKIVMLDFWTYGCINCMHVIPDFKRLEEEFPTELVVIGVHSAKFENESVTENIRQIVQRYGVTHPVVNDADFVIWQTYGVRAWPTAGLIDPLGNVVGGRSGEGVYDAFAPIIRTMVEEYGAAGLLDPTPIALAPELDALPELPLSFPGKVLVDEAGERLFIADSGHNRIVIADLNNFEVLQIIGSGDAALQDGDFATASFNTPQGMALVGDILYVADTNNHAIRAVNLTDETVLRVAGTGNMGTFQIAEGDALYLDLRSPWDVTEQDGILYIAMAGSHQLWALNLDDMTLELFAGNGAEELIDGPRRDAELAQPSGVESDGTYIYFADSEASAIRRAGIADDGDVETVIGPVNAPQGRLFEFGDVDGGIDEARLQHPLGVTIAEDGMVYIADTYNNKIKVIDPDAQTVETFAGNAQGGYFDGVGEEALFDEPGGLDYSDGKLYVADTNNHAIRIIDLETRSTSTVIFPNVTVLLPNATAAVDEPLGGNAEVETLLSDANTLEVPPQQVAPGAGTIMVDAVMPFGYKLNAQAPFTILWALNDVVQMPENEREYRVVTPELPIEFPVFFVEGQTEFTAEVTIYWCEAIKETLCFVERSTVTIPVSVSADAVGSVISISYPLTPPDIPENTFD